MTEQIGLHRLTGLIAFARVAALGSYTSAARALGVSPSAVSKSINRLERELGLALFARTTRSLTLTAGGRNLYERAIRLLQEVDALEQTAFAAKAEPSGMLKITAPLPVGVHVLAPYLPAFRRRYPKVTIDLRLSDGFVDLVREGIDIALRVGDQSDSRLISRPIAMHRIGAFAAPGYLAERGIPSSIDDLAEHDLVNFRFQSTGQLLRWPGDRGKRPFDVLAPLVIDTSEAVAAALVAGGGIGISPTYVAAQYVSIGLLRPVLPELTVDRAPIVALWPESRRENPAVRAFVDFLEQTLVAPTPWDRTVDAHR
ncbi:DNA-binding transcriptional regulator, LysR family [Luteibacter sp. 329MFSha]|nr:DNA-binding transcriptional regulator, LysR family [Luteibacter sp. 329MFSha]